MRERPSARVVLLDPEGRIALMRGRLPGAPKDDPGAWFTVGGEIEAGESLTETATREVREETGLEVLSVGPVLWAREGVWRLGKTEVYAKEQYILARCVGGELSREGWLAHENDLCTDLRWWTREALAETADTVYPQGLAELLVEVLDGRFPDPPKVLPW